MICVLARGEDGLPQPFDFETPAFDAFYEAFVFDNPSVDVDPLTSLPDEDCCSVFDFGVFEQGSDRGWFKSEFCH